MATRGRKPKPTALKILEGNPGHRPIQKEPDFGVSLLKPVKGLSKEAKKEWRRVAKILHSAGITTQADLTAMRMYISSFEKWVTAKEKAKIETLTTDKGYEYANPYIAIERQYFKQLKEILVEFGLTPSSRARLHVTPAEEEDLEESEFANFVAQSQRRIT